MFDKLDSHAIKAILVAEEESRRLGHKFVDTEQLLLGLLMDGQGVPAVVLDKLGLKHQIVRKRICDVLGRGSDFVGVETPFTPRLKQLLEVAWQAAQARGKEYIGSEHLLLGFVEVNDGLAGEILTEAKITPQMLREEIDRTLA